MPRSVRTPKKPLAAAASDDDDSSTPQDVAPETPPDVRTRTRQVFISHNYGGAKSNTAYQMFAEALGRAMKNQKLSASEVARRVWGTSLDSRGYTVAKNRDRIGHYLAGTSYPEQDNLVRLADAVGVPVEELQVERPEGNPGPRPRRSSSGLHIGPIVGQPDKVRVHGQIDEVIDKQLAKELFDLFLRLEPKESDPAKPSEGS